MFDTRRLVCKILLWVWFWPLLISPCRWLHYPHAALSAVIMNIMGSSLAFFWRYVDPSDSKETPTVELLFVANLTAWCSGARGCASTRDVLLLDAVRLCAGVPARSVVRRDDDEVQVEDG
ncbi:unnamed protein product [Prunus armeniaca]